MPTHDDLYNVLTQGIDVDLADAILRVFRCIKALEPENHGRAGPTAVVELLNQS